MSDSPLQGRRVHIAGSAGTRCDPGVLQYAHEFIAALVSALAARGATFVVPIDKEPQLADDPNALSITFDWTVLAAAWSARSDRPSARGFLHVPYITAVAHAKSLTQIPSHRDILWRDIRADVHLIDLGEWNVGALRREAQAREGDILVALGGSEGVWHLANLYHDAGKPVIPLDLPLGYPEGGAEFLHRRWRSRTATLFRTRDAWRQAALFAAASIAARPPCQEAVARVLALLEALCPPVAFCVRLLNENHTAFHDVQAYFERVVEPVAAEAGYDVRTVGAYESREPFVNVELFQELHYSQLVIADYTGERPNCFLELGYGFGRAKPVLVSARAGTVRPFDVEAVQTHFWDPDGADEHRRNQLREHWVKYVGREPLVAPRPLA